jgi:hypothetical protein
MGAAALLREMEQETVTSVTPAPMMECMIANAWAYPADYQHDLIGMPELDWPRLFDESGMTRRWVRYERKNLAEWCVPDDMLTLCVAALDNDR